MNLNQNAARLCRQLEEHANRWGVAVERSECGTRLFDFGLYAPGGLEAGRLLAEICLADLGAVQIVPGQREIVAGPAVTVRTDQPLRACMGSQYAGWQIAGERFFAMGSGPMRAASGREKLIYELDLREPPAPAAPEHTRVVGVLETGKNPPSEICSRIATDCGVGTEELALLFAPTRSIAGGVQVVARTVETALHKLHELKFDIRRVRSGFGVAPLPPVSVDDLTAIGRTNDAVLYGGEVTLWIDGVDDAALTAIGPQIPSSASRDHGEAFGQIFERYGRDFYKIDPQLFSPAVVTLISLASGRSWRFGEFRSDVLRKSFEG